MMMSGMLCEGDFYRPIQDSETAIDRATHAIVSSPIALEVGVSEDQIKQCPDAALSLLIRLHEDLYDVILRPGRLNFDQVLKSSSQMPLWSVRKNKLR